MAVFLVVASFRMLWVYQYFRDRYYLHHQGPDCHHRLDDGGNIDIWNSAKLIQFILHDYTTQKTDTFVFLTGLQHLCC